MDEEDGRPGPQARKFVLADVQMDAFAKSLCHPHTNLNPYQLPRLLYGADLPKASSPAGAHLR
jgi:hypothetical protein